MSIGPDGLFKILGSVDKRRHPSPSWEGFHVRCFFHLVNGREAILDDAGVEVRDAAAAKAQAMKAISELRQESGGAVEEWAGWRLNVVCPQGTLLHSILLSSTFH
jgi:hypothetical protein